MSQSQVAEVPEMRRSFDGYELIRRLGSGAMGSVYLAHDLSLDRRVALKFSAPTDTMPFARERLVREAKAVGRISHPNVVSLYGMGSVDEQPYIVYEYVEGTSLDALPRPAPWPQVVRIGIGLARALSAVHRRNVVHRDVKPSNAILTARGQIKLLDFGLAMPMPMETGQGAVSSGSRSDQVVPSEGRLTDSGLLMGTPLFLSPERWQGAPADRRSDMYSLGILLYEQLAGELSHADLSIPELALFTCSQDLPSLARRLPGLPRALTSLIDRCVRRDPLQRPQDMDEVRAVLEHLSTDPDLTMITARPRWPTDEGILDLALATA